MKKSILTCCIMLLCLLGLTACSSQDRNLDNNVQEIFPDIEGTDLYGYMETYEIPSDSESYIKAEKVSFDTIKNELAVQKELIPFEGVLGGTPYIMLESVALVGDQWIYCYAEDGHVYANMLVKFAVDEQDNVEFRICATDFNGQGTVLAAPLMPAEEIE